MRQYVIGNWLRGYFVGDFSSEEEAWSWLSARFNIAFPPSNPDAKEGRYIQFYSISENERGFETKEQLREGHCEMNDLPRKEVLERCKMYNVIHM